MGRDGCFDFTVSKHDLAIGNHCIDFPDAQLHALCLFINEGESTAQH